MDIKIERFALKSTHTVGRMYIDGEYFCDTLELPVVDGKRGTAILAGKYPVILNYSPKLKRKLPRVLCVPFRDGILFYRGKTVADTAGCILVGENKEVGKVLNSTKYEKLLVEKLAKGTQSARSWVEIVEV